LSAAGSLYGVTVGGGVSNEGTVFALTPGATGAWSKTILHSFSGGTDGSQPNSIAIAPSGELYGTTFDGGIYSEGTVFKIVP
jgi:uncharacterized repeat protein (TIGR03803 family)